MKKYLAVLIVLFFLLCGCANRPKIDPSSHANAYFQMFENVYESNTGLVYELTYLAIDFSQLEFDDLDLLIGMFEDFCEDNDMVLLQGTLEEMIDLGYIETQEFNGTIFPVSFTNGIHFKILNAISTENEVTCDLALWKANMGAAGGSFTAIFDEEQWCITRNTYWVS